MNSLDEILKNNISGIYYGNRILLPFHCLILKIGIEKHLLTDFSEQSKDASVKLNDKFTEIYFFNYPDIENNISKFENIKMIVVEEEKDPFDFSTHRKIAVRPEGNHILSIKELDQDTIFID